MAISDQIAVMKDGVIQQIGRPKELYHKPANEFVATFIGRTNIIPATLEKRSDGAISSFQMAMLFECQLLIRLRSKLFM